MVRHIMESPRAVRRALFGGALVFVAGLVAVLVVFFRDTGNRTAVQSTVSNEPAQTVGTDKNVPLPPEARQVAGKFILTAVKRVHLADAWKLVGPGIREDLTFKQWLTGSIPVVPVLEPIIGATYKTDYSHPDEVEFEVAVIVKPAQAGANSAKVFYMKVRRIGPNRTWVVDSWIPRVPVAIPATPGR